MTREEKIAELRSFFDRFAAIAPDSTLDAAIAAVPAILAAALARREPLSPNELAWMSGLHASSPLKNTDA
jgi:hypothetical protein